MVPLESDPMAGVRVTVVVLAGSPTPAARITEVIWPMVSIEQGAATAIWSAVSPQLDGKGGVYCEDCDIARLVPADDKGYRSVRPYAVDQDAADALWGLSEKLTHVQFKCEQ